MTTGVSGTISINTTAMAKGMARKLTCHVKNSTVGANQLQRLRSVKAEGSTISFHTRRLKQSRHNKIDEWNHEEAAGARLLDHNLVSIEAPEDGQQQRHIHELIAFLTSQRLGFISHPAIFMVSFCTVPADFDKGRAWSSKPQQGSRMCFQHSIDGQTKSSDRKKIMICAIFDIHSHPFPAIAKQLPTQIAIPSKEFHKVILGTLPYTSLIMTKVDE